MTRKQTIPDKVDVDVDRRIDFCATARLFAPDLNAAWETFFRPYTDALETALDRPERLARVFRFLELVCGALEFRTPQQSESAAFPILGNLAALQEEIQRRLATMARWRRRAQKGRPPEGMGLDIVMFGLIGMTGWSARTASRYVAKRVARIWSDAEELPTTFAPGCTRPPLTPEEVRSLWGGWWATAPSERRSRETRLAERIRLAYIESFGRSVPTSKMPGRSDS
jgi:hypothetical protein